MVGALAIVLDARINGFYLYIYMSLHALTIRELLLSTLCIWHANIMFAAIGLVGGFSRLTRKTGLCRVPSKRHWWWIMPLCYQSVVLWVTC